MVKMAKCHGACMPATTATQKAEAERLQIWGQTEKLSKTLSQKIKIKKKKIRIVNFVLFCHNKNILSLINWKKDKMMLNNSQESCKIIHKNHAYLRTHLEVGGYSAVLVHLASLPKALEQNKTNKNTFE